VTAKTKRTSMRQRKTTTTAKQGGDTKKAIVLALMRRKEGATTADIAKATGWQNHSILRLHQRDIDQEDGTDIDSVKSESGKRTYRIAE